MGPLSSTKRRDAPAGPPARPAGRPGRAAPRPHSLEEPALQMGPLSSTKRMATTTPAPHTAVGPGLYLDAHLGARHRRVDRHQACRTWGKRRLTGPGS